MKKFNYILMMYMFLINLTVPCMLIAASTTDTMIVPNSSELWAKFVLFAGASVVTCLLGLLVFIAKVIYEVARKYIATTKYAQTMGVLLESLATSLSKFAASKGKSYIEMLQDFKITKEEQDIIIKDAQALAAEELQTIRGFVKDVGGDWVKDKLNLLLGELVSRVAGSNVKGISNTNSK